MIITFEKANNVLNFYDWEGCFYLSDYNVESLNFGALKDKETLKEIEKALTSYTGEGPLVAFVDGKLAVTTANKGWNECPILFSAKAKDNSFRCANAQDGELHMVTRNRGRGALTTYWTNLIVKKGEKDEVVLISDYSQNYNRSLRFLIENDNIYY